MSLSLCLSRLSRIRKCTQDASCRRGHVESRVMIDSRAAESYVPGVRSEANQVGETSSKLRALFQLSFERFLINSFFLILFEILEAIDCNLFQLDSYYGCREICKKLIFFWNFQEIQNVFLDFFCAFPRLDLP